MCAPCQKALTIIVTKFLCTYLFIHYNERCLRSSSLSSVFMYSLSSSLQFSAQWTFSKRHSQTDPSHLLLDVQKISKTADSIKVTDCIEGHWLIENWHIIFPLPILIFPAILCVFKQSIEVWMPVYLPFVMSVIRLTGSLCIVFWEEISILQFWMFLKFKFLISSFFCVLLRNA